MTETQRDLLINFDDGDEADEGSSGLADDDDQRRHSRRMSEWEVLKERIGVFSSPDRMQLLEELKRYQQALVERSELLARNARMRRHNQELAMILRRSQTA